MNRSRLSALFVTVMCVTSPGVAQPAPPARPAAADGGTCPAPYAACGGERCADLDNDAAHCGECGHVCGEGVCREGRCATRWDESAFQLDTHLTIVSSRPSPVLWGFDLGSYGEGHGVGARLDLQFVDEPLSDYADGTEKMSVSTYRVGGFFRQNFYRTELDPLQELAAFVELSAQLELQHYGLPAPVNQLRLGAGADDTSRGKMGVSLLAAVLLGVDFGIVQGLRAGVSGGLQLIGNVHAPFGQASDPQFPFVMLLTASYTFNRAPKPPAPAPLPPYPAQPPSYVLVRGELVLNEALDRPPQITATEQYREARDRYRKVALVAPPGCESLGTTAVPAQGEPAILANDCGRELTLIERALIDAGYSVISSTMLTNRGGASAAEAAAALGANVLLQIRTLERSAQPLGDAAQLRLSYQASDVRGAPGPANPLNEHDRALLRELYDVPVQSELLQGRIPEVTLEVDAIAVPTRETVWSFRWQHAERPSAGSIREFLARGDRIAGKRTEEAGPEYRWSAAALPASAAVKPSAAPVYTAQDTQSLPAGQGSDRARFERELERSTQPLWEQSVKQFVEAFKLGWVARRAQP